MRRSGRSGTLRWKKAGTNSNPWRSLKPSEAAEIGTRGKPTESKCLPAGGTNLCSHRQTLVGGRGSARALVNWWRLSVGCWDRKKPLELLKRLFVQIPWALWVQILWGNGSGAEGQNIFSLSPISTADQCTGFCHHSTGDIPGCSRRKGVWREAVLEDRRNIRHPKKECYGS